MRVLMLSLDRSLADPEGRGGGDTFHRHMTYASWLADEDPNGGELHVLMRAPSNARPDTLHHGPLTVHVVPTRRSFLHAKLVSAGLRVTRERRFDVITSQTPFDDGAAALILGRIRRVPVNIQMRSSFLDNPYWIAHKPRLYRVFNRLGQMVSNRATTIRVISIGERDRLAARYPELASKIFVLPPLINLAAFPAQSPVPAERERRGALFVGRLSWEKNVETLLSGWSLLRKRSQSSVLEIVGDGPLRRALEAKAVGLGLNGAVRWHGMLPIDTLQQLYRRAVVTVLPSFYEGFGKVIVESYLSGTPVICGPFVSARELVDHERTGFILPRADDAESLATYLASLLESPERAASMGGLGCRMILDYLPSEAQHRDRQLAIWRSTAARRIA
jgi:glycosyltransferase involved in cell wall biosynthesis